MLRKIKELKSNKFNEGLKGAFKYLFLYTILSFIIALFKNSINANMPLYEVANMCLDVCNLIAKYTTMILGVFELIRVLILDSMKVNK